MNTHTRRVTEPSSFHARLLWLAPPLLTFIDMHLQDLLLPQDFAPGAGFAAVAVAQALALTSAAHADGGELMHHAGE